MVPDLYFEGNYEPTRQDVRVRLLEGFTEDHWPALERQQQAWFDQGLRHYLLDLTCIQQLTSRVIGLFIGLNARMTLRGGRVRLVVLEGSRLAGTIHMMRLHKLMDVESVRGSQEIASPSPASGRAVAPAPAAATAGGEESAP